MAKTFTIQAYNPKGINGIHVQTGASVARFTAVDFKGCEYNIEVVGIYPNISYVINATQTYFCGNIKTFINIRFVWMLEK